MQDTHPEPPASPGDSRLPLTSLLLLLTGSWLCQPPSFISPPTTSCGTTCVLRREAGATTSPCWPGPSPGVSTLPPEGPLCPPWPLTGERGGSLGCRCPALGTCLSRHAAPTALGWLPQRTELMPGVVSVAVGAVTVISPLELIRTKMQSRQLSYRELGLCIQSAVAQDGWMSLWRGWGPTVLRDVPFSGTAAAGWAERWHWEMGGMEEHGTAGQRTGRLVCLGCLVALAFLLSSQLSTGLTTSW